MGPAYTSISCVVTVSVPLTVKVIVTTVNRLKVRVTVVPSVTVP